MTLILTNVILNNIQEILAVDQTSWINVGGAVTCKPDNSKST